MTEGSLQLSPKFWSASCRALAHMRVIHQQEYDTAAFRSTCLHLSVDDVKVPYNEESSIDIPIGLA